MASFSLGQLASMLDATLEGGDKTTLIHSVAPLSHAIEGQLSFLGDPKYRSQLADTQATVVILSAEEAIHCPTASLIVENPAASFAQLAGQFARQYDQPVGIHATAVVADSADIDPTASIGPGVVIGRSVTVGANTVLYPNVVIADDVTIGSNTTIYPNAVVYPRTTIGDEVVIHSGAAIGSDGFGNVQEAGRWRRMPQLGRTIIGNDVDIGANTTIDCGALGDTVIGDGVRIDNLIQIAHNVKIGDHTALAAQVGIAGSTEIGKHCMLGGKVGVNGHIKVCDQVMVTASSNISKSIDKPGLYASHFPAESHRSWLKNLAGFRKLSALIGRINKVEQRLEYLENEE